MGPGLPVPQSPLIVGAGFAFLGVSNSKMMFGNSKGEGPSFSEDRGPTKPVLHKPQGLGR